VLLPYARSGSNTRLSSISRASKFSRLESLQNLILFWRVSGVLCVCRACSLGYLKRRCSSACARSMKLRPRSVKCVTTASKQRGGDILSQRSVMVILSRSRPECTDRIRWWADACGWTMRACRLPSSRILMRLTAGVPRRQRAPFHPSCTWCARDGPDLRCGPALSGPRRAARRCNARFPALAKLTRWLVHVITARLFPARQWICSWKNKH